MADERREGFEEMVALASQLAGLLNQDLEDAKWAHGKTAREKIARAVLSTAGVEELLRERDQAVEWISDAEARVDELEAALRRVQSIYRVQGPTGDPVTVRDRMAQEARAALSSPDRNTNREER